MKTKLKRLAPPGARVEQELLLFGLMLGGAVIGSVAFFVRFDVAKELLYERIGSEKVLIEGAVMPPFPDMLHYTWVGFAIAALTVLCMVPWHYLTYRMGSMSIYLMRRLPNRRVLHKTCWTLPLLGVLVILLTALLLAGVYCLCYLNMTPAGHLPPDIWRV